MSPLLAFFLLPFVVAAPCPATVGLHNESLETSYESRQETKAPPAPEPEAMEFSLRSFLFMSGSGFVSGFILIRLLKIARGRKRVQALAGLPFCCAWLLSLQDARACINTEDETLEGTYTDYTDDGWFTGTVHNAMMAKASDDPHLKPNPAAYPSPPAPGILESDEAARMTIRGDAAGALEKLKQIEATHPGLYEVAANMGTAYELTGDNESALKWITEGIRRNPDSHMRAEWLHAKILEAKIAMKTDPAWLEKHSITGLDPLAPTFRTLQGHKSGWEILQSMRSQATVRALFIKPQDPILAHLLKEAAAFALKSSPSSVNGMLDLAVTYGLPESATNDLRAAFTAIVNQDRVRVEAQSTAWGRYSRFTREHWPWMLFGVCALAGGVAAARMRMSRRA